MKLSVVIPAHNEQGCIRQAIEDVASELSRAGIDYEIVCVNDNSTDGTRDIIEGLAGVNPRIKPVNRQQPSGFGRALREGLSHTTGDAVAVVMGDQSDDPKDIVRCFRKLEEGYDCVFGSRFLKGSVVKDYPLLKLMINRLANTFVQALFLLKENDITNAFKLYRADVINAIQPLQAQHFNITVEMPLKAIVRGFSFAQIPINWYGRKSGLSKLSIRALSRKYLFTVLYVWLEKLLIQDELHRGRALKR